MPLPGRNFVKHHIRNNPDLYGNVKIISNLAEHLSTQPNNVSIFELIGIITKLSDILVFVIIPLDRSFLDLCDSSVLRGHQWRPLHISE